MADAVAMDRPWRLALIIDDVEAIKIGAAFYALPKRDRRDLDKLADASGIRQNVSAALARLDAAGMLDGDDSPPEILVRMINSFVNERLKKGK
jgi:hypothetical protein